MTVVCGDSHTATHGAFGALAFGIGTSEVEHVLATQTLPQSRPKWMSVTVDGELPAGVTAKDIVLAIIGRDRHRRRHRPRHRVPRLGDPGALDGGPHDAVQHVDRGGCPGRPRRPRRHDLRLPAGPRPRAEGRRVGCRGRRLEDARHRRRRRVGQGGRDRRLHDHPAGHVGHQPRPGRLDRRERPVARRLRPIRPARDRRPRPRVHGSQPGTPIKRSPSTPCSSARAPTAASRTSVPPPR
jgi:hypothetical protein